MSAEIVERLRTGMVMTQPKGISPYPWVVDRQFCDEAADEIERLRKLIVTAYYTDDEERVELLGSELRA